MSSLKRTHTGKKFGGVGQEPGLVVMGGDSCSKGREFESQHQLLDRHFSHLFIVKIKNCNDFLEKIVNKNGKKAGDGPFKK